MGTANRFMHVRFNFIVNVLDGGFYGLGLGLASYVTVIPLFIASLTDSTILIGLIATLHSVGWQLPQVFTSGMVSRRTVYRPLVLFMTIQERWPFFGLGLLAVAATSFDRNVVLLLAFVLICWQAFGGGLTATAWQTMIGKLIPPYRRGVFYGMQSMAANLLASIGSVIAGFLLVVLPYPVNFAAVFLLASLAMVISFTFLLSTREFPHTVDEKATVKRRGDNRRIFNRILRADANFRWFLIVRVVSQFAAMVIAFYTIYAVRQFGIDNQVAGVLTGILLLGQTITSPIVGWAGDRWGHRDVFAFGNLLIALSAVIALTAPTVDWLYVVFFLVGAYNNTQWTSILALTVQFGSEIDRPYYIGISNTLTGPATLIAPIIGGFLADAVGFGATFGLAIVAAGVCLILTLFFMQDPLKQKRTQVLSTGVAAD